MEGGAGAAGGGGGGRGRGGGGRGGLLPLEGALSRGASPKVKSGWLVEREAIMREFGEYAISGLVLAQED